MISSVSIFSETREFPLGSVSGTQRSRTWRDGSFIIIRRKRMPCDTIFYECAATRDDEFDMIFRSSRENLHRRWTATTSERDRYCYDTRRVVNCLLRSVFSFDRTMCARCTCVVHDPTSSRVVGFLNGSRTVIRVRATVRNRSVYRTETIDNSPRFRIAEIVRHVLVRCDEWSGKAHAVETCTALRTAGACSDFRFWTHRRFTDRKNNGFRKGESKRSFGRTDPSPNRFRARFANKRERNEKTFGSACRLPTTRKAYNNCDYYTDASHAVRRTKTE